MADYQLREPELGSAFERPLPSLVPDLHLDPSMTVPPGTIPRMPLAAPDQAAPPRLQRGVSG